VAGLSINGWQYFQPAGKYFSLLLFLLPISVSRGIFPAALIRCPAGSFVARDSEEICTLMEIFNACLDCGACCAWFRASFYWAEGNDVTPGGVPVHLTEKLTDFRRVMIGTNRPEPRCIALEGAIGSEVRCVIYAMRSSVCRGFAASWSNGVRNENCDAARKAWGLQPLMPGSWNIPDNPPKAA